MSLHQRRNIAVLSTGQQIAFPMTRNRSVFRLRRSFADGDGIDDPALGVSVNAGVPRAAHVPLRSQLVQQLFFQYSPRLNEQAAVNGLVGHAHALFIGILLFQPSGDLATSDSWPTGNASVARP